MRYCPVTIGVVIPLLDGTYRFNYFAIGNFLIMQFGFPHFIDGSIPTIFIYFYLDPLSSIPDITLQHSNSIL
jgi:hypothetical protein